MTTKTKSIEEYFNSIYLPKYFIEISKSNRIYFDCKNARKIHIKGVRFKEVKQYIMDNQEKLKTNTFLQFFDELLKPIYFSLEELRSIQGSDDPFTISELKNILEDELERPIDEMNTDVIEYLLTQI